MNLSAHQTRILKSLVCKFKGRDKVEFWRKQYPRADATLALMQTKGLIVLDADHGTIAVTVLGEQEHHLAQMRYNTMGPGRWRK